MFKIFKQNKIYLLLLGAIVIFTISLNLFKFNQIPGCLNPDEAAFGYNAYSILQTLKDEHGNFLPMRLKSFDDFKMPLYSYLSIPSVALFGMSDFSVRLLNLFVAAGLALSSYFLFKKVIEDEKIALLGSFFVSASIWTLIVTRHAHEAALSTLFITLSSYFAVGFFENKTFKTLLLTLLFALFSAFSYHIGRIYLIFVVGSILFFLIKNIRQGISKTSLFLTVTTLLIPTFIDLQYGVNRLSNLAFYKNIGFTLRINEYLNEHNIRLIHNKLTEGIIFFTNNYLRLLSPDFLVVTGDPNQKFGYLGMNPITPILYICAIIGVFALLRNKNRFRFYFLGLLLVAPIGSALTWQPVSLTRTCFLIIPLGLFASYGFFELKKNMNNLVVLAIFLAHLFFLFFAYDVYFFHYFKRPTVQSAWQCGNKELANYVKENYSKFDKFYITTKNGQPYIYLLFYNKIDPSKFQKETVRTKRDEHGFTQVAKFDKFVFTMPSSKDQKRTAYIGFPDEMGDQYNEKIKYHKQDIFLVKENK
ncbi:hypothetical protein A2690_04125 [Candidatus Roizmanbacteria bacterium RIFCSPHIGHO2_01_FULL_39_12b]|uniref:Uncharacterized protein n=1 Tax=Candidatus Roizmanbacteria bacterium RIFCSPHIGHO2_01_FULL_39_12b TaxID=1802030 RepID=A0A1F7GC92_9BACT|nr:MAG: hypothetical protein A2690_04125 [Candidatus Roizmanbacteria bacterium RIFCSPHIGHO2_01_FULL_39_12b]OGK47129.1 MAG: hypothetical protein A3B46_01850 [Candidatus Roizmanbacteria bacterium RIFCSPLOWO2_01_FULL_39_19]